MRFLDAKLQREFDEALHPEVCARVHALDEWCEDNGLPQVVVTCVLRDKASNAAVNGKEASWHLVAAAVDLRSRHYSPRQLGFVVTWLRAQCPLEEWELLVHDVGAGPHLHLARKDASWRATFEKRPAVT